jgi:hypothetical protein
MSHTLHDGPVTVSVHSKGLGGGQAVQFTIREEFVELAPHEAFRLAEDIREWYLSR